MDTEQNMKQNLNFLENYVVGRPKTSFSARFCAFFQNLRSLPDSAKNSAGAENKFCRILEGLKKRFTLHISLKLSYVDQCSKSSRSITTSASMLTQELYDQTLFDL